MQRILASRLALLGALLALPAAAPAPDTGLELLRRTGEKYRAASTFQIEGDIHAEVTSGERHQSSDATFRLAVGGGGRVRDQLDHPQAGVTKVSDGTQTWMYVNSLGQYARKSLVDSIDFSRAAQSGGMLGVLVGTLRDIAEGVDSLRVLPDETVSDGKRDRPCAVVEVRYRLGAGPRALPNAPRTFWIDRERGLVVKSLTVSRTQSPDGKTTVEQTETLHYTLISLGKPIDPAIFTFQPPAGAKLVEQFSSGARAENLAGQEAKDFTLFDVDGKLHRLKDHRGEVVMLDFWASWCGPCRLQMPLVEKLGHEYQGKGLVVYAVNQGESAETARKYLAKYKYTTTALLDQKVDVGREYKVSGIPTLVIIDRNGKIAAHYIGLRTEDVLREGLKKAGL